MQKGLNIDLGWSGTVTWLMAMTKQEQRGFVWRSSLTSAGSRVNCFWKRTG